MVFPIILDLQLSLRILHVGDRTHGCQGYLCHGCHGCLYCTHYGNNCVTRKLLQKEESLLQVFGFGIKKLFPTQSS